MTVIKTKHFEMEMNSAEDVDKLEREIKEINRRKREFLSELKQMQKIEFAEKHAKEFERWLQNKDQVFIDDNGKIANNDDVINE